MARMRDGVSTTMPGPRTCLFVGRHPAPVQTFANRHIVHLFEGNTCLLCTSHTGENPYGKALHVLSASPAGGLAGVTRSARRLWNAWRYGTSNVPVAREEDAVRTFLEEQRVEIILCEFGGRAAKIAPLAAKMGLPCFVYFRGPDVTKGLRKARRVRGYRTLFPMLDGIFAVSQFLLDEFAAAGLTHPNAHVLPSGVDVRRFVPGKKVPLTYLAVGRMVEKKAPLTTLRAFATATRDLPGARLRFIGDGPLLEATRSLASKLGVSDKVRLDGAAPHEEVRGALETAHVFLQHSIVSPSGDAEGLPTAIQEAMAAGCVVVSTRHAGIPEAIEHGVNGWLSEEGDEAEFARLIGQALAADGAAIARAARQTAETRFDNEVLMARVEDVLRAGLKDRVPHS